jgi:glutamine synthetase
MTDGGNKPTHSREALLAELDANQVVFVALWFTDITGIVKSVTVPAHKLVHVLDHGLHFDGSSIEGFARVAESDMLLVPDPSTLAIFPWDTPDERTARLLCNVSTPEGAPFIGDPRTVLQRQLREAEALGFRFKTGMELEFFLFRAGEDGPLLPLQPFDEASYFDLSNDLGHSVRRRLVTTLESLCIRVDTSHHEIGSGQHEIDLEYRESLIMADQLLTARAALRSVAMRHGLHCTFMPRPSALLPGSGMHTHQSLHDVVTDANVFADPSHQYGLSETARWFLAGQLAHARAMTAVIAPLVNSYKRLATSFEAPRYVAWAHVNRAGAAMIRVPHVAGHEEHTRLEIRCPDPSSNPYLATTVMLAAGLDGIRSRTPLPDALEETLIGKERARHRPVETLPSSLDEALAALEQDDVILEALGPYISDRYLAAKRQELESYHGQVTAWEVDRYLARY